MGRKTLEKAEIQTITNLQLHDGGVAFFFLKACLVVAIRAQAI